MNPKTTIQDKSGDDIRGARQIVDFAKSVIRAEIAGLLELEQQLNDRVAKAVDLILGSPGRVIVSGMGKSGHIARKIAATLASTGTPAQYVHPAEASHGDLGMITANDICLMISNSGETKELSDILGHCKRFGVSLIAITREEASTLGRHADLVLPLPSVPEACEIGMVPTTSTTATLVLGDALALSLMNLRGFGTEQFLTYHPGGKLGSQLLTVGNLMHSGDSLPIVGKETPMSETLVTMSAKGFGIAIVESSGQLHGIVTDGDLRRNMHHLMNQVAGEVCTKHPQTVDAKTLITEAIKLMNEKKISVLCVVDSKNRVIGLIHVHDCLRAGIV